MRRVRRVRGVRNTQGVMPIPEAEIRAELDRILASKSFVSAGRLSRLLRYIVDKTLAGESNQLKEYAVGVEVFERDAKYDPRVDSIVRVEAGRLRSKLDEYYNGDTQAPGIRIGLPRGGYAATFERRANGIDRLSPSPSLPITAAASNSERHTSSPPLIRVAFVAVLFLAVGGMLMWLVMRDRGPRQDLRPTAAVLPIAANMIGGDNDNYSAQMTEAITSELARLGTVSVASFTSSMQFAGRRPSMSEVATALKSRYVVEASVDDEASQILVVARIVNSETDRKMWVSDYRGARDDVRGMAQRIAFDVSAAILEREAGR